MGRFSPGGWEAVRGDSHLLGYGLVAISLHWLVAFVVIGLFALGVWMTDLTYYDDWYKRAPDLHKGVGILLFLAMLGRVVWRALNVTPDCYVLLSSRPPLLKYPAVR